MRFLGWLMLLTIGGCPATTDTADGDTDTDTDSDTDTDTGLTCETEACGGDPTGTWNIVEVCHVDVLKMSLLSTYCSNQDDFTIAVTSIGTPTGTMIFESPAVSVDAFAVDYSWEANISAACLDTTCSGLQSNFDYFTTLTAACEDDGAGGCDCRGDESYLCEAGEPGCLTGYSIEEDEIHVASFLYKEGGEWHPFCVDGDRARMQFVFDVRLERQ